jgi:hypothetical protein
MSNTAEMSETSGGELVAISEAKSVNIREMSETVISDSLAT